MTPKGAGAGTALVIGATGLIGRHASTELERAGHQVVRTSTTGRDAGLSCDLTEPESVVTALEASSPETIVMAAGISSVGAAWEDPEAAFEANTAGAFHLLEAIRRAAPSSHLLFASSGSVYGSPEPESPGAGAEPFSEEDRLRPGSPYAASKAAAEVLCRQYAREYGLSVSVVRIFNQIGPGQTPGQAPAEFALEIARAEAGGQTRLEVEVGNPGSRRDYTDIRDTSRALAALAGRRATGTFNLCAGRTASIEQIVAGLAAESPVEVGIAVKPGRAHPVDPEMVAGSNRRLVELTGWEPAVSLAESLAVLLADWRRRV